MSLFALAKPCVLVAVLRCVCAGARAHGLLLAQLETVGQVGRPKTITGFQTHTTPVLLAAKERAELGTDEYIALSSVLEGFVILRKNPEASAAAAKP